MGRFKKKTEDELIQVDGLDFDDNEPQATKVEAEEEFNPNSLEIVIDRVEHGLVGTLKIVEDDTNKPIFRNGDYVHFIAPARLEKKDFVLYKSHDNFFIRRIIKFDDENIYVAGDHEREYHIIHKEDVVGKAIGRQRKKKYISFALNPSKGFYTFRKVKLAPFRLGKRVTSYDEDQSQESYEIAMQNLGANVQQQATQKPTPVYTDIDLDSDLASFLNPDDLVREIRAQATEEEVSDDESEEVVEYEEVIEEEASESNEEETLEDEEIEEDEEA